MFSDDGVRAVPAVKRLMGERYEGGTTTILSISTERDAEPGYVDDKHLEWADGRVDPDEVTDDFQLAQLPMGELYEDFDRLYCRLNLWLETDDNVNDIDAGEIGRYNTYAELFELVTLGAEARFEVVEADARYGDFEEPRVIDVENG